MTLIYYSANRLPEIFAYYIRENLMQKAEVLQVPIISVTQSPVDLGESYVVKYPVNYYSCYKQLLLGATKAKTEYFACCEDDALYCLDHFSYRPKKSTAFLYNFNHWYVNPGFYHQMRRAYLFAGIFHRETFIEVMEKRFEKFPDNPGDKNIDGFGEPAHPRHERKLGLKEGVLEKCESRMGILTFNHAMGCGKVRKYRERYEKTDFLKNWGYAEDIWRYYWEGWRPDMRKIYDKIDERHKKDGLV